MGLAAVHWARDSYGVVTREVHAQICLLVRWRCACSLLTPRLPAPHAHVRVHENARFAQELLKQEFSPEFVRSLLESAGPVPKAERLPPSRMLLLQCYDAAHTRPDGKHQPCALQQVRRMPQPGQMWSSALRLEAAVDLYRKLTGEPSTEAKALGTEADAIAKRRNAMGKNPSGTTQRWFSEPPTAGTARAGHGSFGASRTPGRFPEGSGGGGGGGACGATQRSASKGTHAARETPKTHSPAVEKKTDSPKQLPSGAFARAEPTPGPGSYHTSSSDMSRRVDLSRKSNVFVKPSHAPRQRAQTPPPSRPSTFRPPAAAAPPGAAAPTSPKPQSTSPAFYHVSHNTINQRTRGTGRNTANFAPRSPKNSSATSQHTPPLDGPGPGAYDTEQRALGRSYRERDGQSVKPSAVFASRVTRSSGYASPEKPSTSGPKKTAGPNSPYGARGDTHGSPSSPSSPLQQLGEHLSKMWTSVSKCGEPSREHGKKPRAHGEGAVFTQHPSKGGGKFYVYPPPSDGLPPPPPPPLPARQSQTPQQWEYPPSPTQQQSSWWSSADSEPPQYPSVMGMESDIAPRSPARSPARRAMHSPFHAPTSPKSQPNSAPRRARATSAPPARPTTPTAVGHEPSWAEGERSREAAMASFERASHARLLEAEQRAAAAMQELARVHAELNGAVDVSDEQQQADRRYCLDY